MTHLRAIQFAIIFWGLFTVTQPVEAGSDGAAKARCQQQAAVIEQFATKDAAMMNFGQWVRENQPQESYVVLILSMIEAYFSGGLEAAVDACVQQQT